LRKQTRFPQRRLWYRTSGHPRDTQKHTGDPEYPGAPRGYPWVHPWVPPGTPLQDQGLHPPGGGIRENPCNFTQKFRTSADPACVCDETAVSLADRERRGSGGRERPPAPTPPPWRGRSWGVGGYPPDPRTSEVTTIRSTLGRFGFSDFQMSRAREACFRKSTWEVQRCSKLAHERFLLV
jgi:hypothetical protein